MRHERRPCERSLHRDASEGRGKATPVMHMTKLCFLLAPFQVCLGRPASSTLLTDAGNIISDLPIHKQVSLAIVKNTSYSTLTLHMNCQVCGVCEGFGRYPPNMIWALVHCMPLPHDAAVHPSDSTTRLSIEAHIPLRYHRFLPHFYDTGMQLVRPSSGSWISAQRSS
jgi:hypothetical protein